jgi:uncharacterized membrane protein
MGVVKNLFELITGVLLTLVAGVFWGTWFSLSRTMHVLPPDYFITIGKQIMQNVALTMSIIMPASIIALAILLIGSWKIKGVYFYTVLVSLVLFILALVITLTVEVPIDNQIASWTPETIPADWQHICDRWEQFHTFRTFLSLGSVTFFYVALIYGKGQRVIATR